MKKISLLFASVIVAMAVGLTSCGGNNEPDVPNVTSNVKFHTGFYFGNYLSHYSHMERLVFGTEGTGYDSAYHGTGDIYLIDFCAETQDGFFPKAGTYKTADAYLGETFLFTMISDGEVIPSELVGSGTPIGCYKLKIVDGEVTTVSQAKIATIKFSGSAKKGVMEAKFTMEELDDKNNVVATEDIDVIYGGEFKILDKKVANPDEVFKDEEKAVTNEKFTYDELKGLNNGDVYKCGLNQYSIELKGANNELCQLILYAPAGEKPLGKYTITHKISDFTAERSHGVSAEGIVPPFVAIVESVSGQQATVNKLWYPESGSITIEAEKITFNIVSHNGSTIKGVYDGIVTFTDGGGRAPQRAITKVVKR